MKRRYSVSRLARASSVAVAVALALGGPPAAAQWAGETAVPIIVVDIERAMRDSAAASALRAREIDERRALRARLDALQRALEAEEAELTELRGKLEREAFDARVKDFDQRVRTARRTAQEDAAALQARFAAAETALRGRVAPLIEALRRERGAVLVLEHAAILSARPELDATAALIRRLDDEAPDIESLLSPQ